MAGGPAAAAPSGTQHVIRSGAQEAVVVEVGGGIRSYSVAGRDVLQPYPADAMCDGAHGAPLIPWPNRLDGGRYTFDGVPQQVPITEPGLGNAIHGLTRWLSWGAVEHTADAVTMGLTLRPSPGYPHTLELRVRYALGEDGLSVRTTARNTGAGDCPYAHGQHPYLSPGPGSLDECRLEFGAATRILVDPERRLPAGTLATAGTEFDFGGGRALRGRVLDDAFTDLSRDGGGRAWATLSCPDGRRVRLWADRAFGYLEVFTGDTLAPGRRREGIAVEPMTAPPNAFATGEGVVRLAPGRAAESNWGVVLD